MGNPLNGEVDFPVGDKTYRLRLSINQLIEVEDITGLGIVQLANSLASPDAIKAGDVRALLWGALREHHPEVDLMGAGELMTTARLQSTIDHVGRALQAAFPEAKGGAENPPRPKRRPAGTGKATS